LLSTLKVIHHATYAISQVRHVTITQVSHCKCLQISSYSINVDLFLSA